MRIGSELTGLTGAGWAIAAAADHLGEMLTVAPSREGVLSEALEVGIMVVGALLAAASDPGVGSGPPAAVMIAHAGDPFCGVGAAGGRPAREPSGSRHPQRV